MTLNRRKNPVSAELNTKDIDLSLLKPKVYTLKNGLTVDVFYSNSLEIINLGLVIEAGKSYDKNNLVANAAIALITEGTKKHSAKEIADFLNYRGINIEKTVEACNAKINIYLQDKYLDEFLPLAYEMFTESIFPENEFNVYLKNKKQEFEKQKKKTNFLAVSACREELFGKDHIFNTSLQDSDFETITLDNVRDFYKRRYKGEYCKLFLAGNVTKHTIETLDNIFGQQTLDYERKYLIPKALPNEAIRKSVYVADAVQTTICMAKIIDTQWNTTDFAKLMVANNILGGYFGSRLMMNVREDKGYCYGIYSILRSLPNANYLLITTDVGTDVTQNAVKEILKELERLRIELVSDEELKISKNYLIGDFIRNIDGVFELSEQAKYAFSFHADETYFKNYLDAIENTTAADVLSLAKKYLDPKTFVQITAGKIAE